MFLAKQVLVCGVEAEDCSPVFVVPSANVYDPVKSNREAAVLGVAPLSPCIPVLDAKPSG